MDWEKPKFVEVPLACEVSSYANAELEEPPKQGQPETRPVRA